jgi:hypothetical protein
MGGQRIKDLIERVGVAISLRVFFFGYFLFAACAAVFMPLSTARVVKDEAKQWKL